MDLPIDKPLVLVTWLDAKDGQTGWHSIEDIEKEKLATCYSVGWLMVRNDEKMTKEVMSGDYFHTGDIGEIDSEGFLKITDRKKEMFKTSGGKYIAPAVIENQMKQSLFVEQIMVVGSGRRMPTAVIQPNIDYVIEWLKEKGIECNSLSKAIQEPILKDEILKEVENHNQNFGSWEQIKKIELTPDVWTIDDGHLTPTMKLKRKVVTEKYKDLIEKMYN